MRTANVISPTRLERIRAERALQSEPERRTDLPPAEEAGPLGDHDELRAGRGILMAMVLGAALWALVILGIRLMLR